MTKILNFFKSLFNTDFFNTVKTFYFNNDILIWWGITLICVLFLLAKFRKKIYQLMTEAETGALTAAGMAELVERIQRSDLDDKMVLVLAKIITMIPIFRILPLSWVVKFLNKITQRMFDNISALLRAKAETKLKKLNVPQENIDRSMDTVNKLSDDVESKIKELIEYNLDGMIKNAMVNKVFEVAGEQVKNGIKNNETINKLGLTNTVNISNNGKKIDINLNNDDIKRLLSIFNK